MKADHLYYQGAFGLPFLQHHVVDLGDGTVVQYGDGCHSKAEASLFERIRTAEVHRIPIERFRLDAKAARSAIYTVHHHGPESGATGRDRVVRRALALLGEQQYCPVIRNCEHLAVECSTGEAASRQVEVIASGLSATVLVALAAALRLPTRLVASGLELQASAAGAARSVKRRMWQATWGRVLPAVEPILQHVPAQLSSINFQARASLELVGAQASLSLRQVTELPAAIGKYAARETASCLTMHRWQQQQQRPVGRLAFPAFNTTACMSTYNSNRVVTAGVRSPVKRKPSRASAQPALRRRPAGRAAMAAATLAEPRFMARPAAVRVAPMLRRFPRIR
eukprot:SAG22_NODE_21_length_31784_cov_15.522897_15_plen_339_part_00